MRSQPNAVEKQIAYLVRQSYDIFNKFGRDPEELKNLIKAHVEDLRSYDQKKITESFLVWRRKKNAMPTPADIIKIIMDMKDKDARRNGLMTWSEFQQRVGPNWGAFKQHLKDQGQLNPTLAEE